MWKMQNWNKKDNKFQFARFFIIMQKKKLCILSQVRYYR